MNFIDITPFVIPERVLNFDFSTQMLFRCIERKYAETFINGEIRFGQPKNWIEKEKNGNKGQGDLLEGRFQSRHKLKFAWETIWIQIYSTKKYGIL